MERNAQNPDMKKYNLHHAQLLELSGALTGARFSTVVQKTKQGLKAKFYIIRAGV